MSNDIIQKENNQVATQSQPQTSPMRLVEMAISNNADVDKLERLMDMQERWEAKEAEKAFNRAMSEFQAECPRITKSKQGHGYKYATLGDIQAQIKQTARDCGISWRWETKEQTADQLTVKCIITHLDGHHQETESTTFIEQPNKMQSRTQMVGVATTYARRYSLIGALGITTADEDIDGRLPDNYKQKPEYKGFRQHRAKMLQEVKDGRSPESIIEALETDYKVTDVTKSEIMKMGGQQDES